MTFYSVRSKIFDAPSYPNGIEIYQPRVDGPRRTGDERLPWETVACHRLALHIGVL